MWNNNQCIVRVPRVFSICTTEVTEQHFREFLKECNLLDAGEIQEHSVPDGPATGHTYGGMLKFCRWLSEKEGIALERIGLPELDKIAPGMKLPRNFLEMDGYRLPTPFEWEITNRAGTITPSYMGWTMDSLSTYAWNSNNTMMHVEPVGRLAPNPFGLFDTLGNAFEVVLGDAHRGGWELKPDLTMHWIYSEDMYMSMRGGSFLSNPIYCSSGSNHSVESKSTDINAGFRIVRVHNLEHSE